MTPGAERTARLELDAERLRTDLDRRSFSIRHHLADHPLFDLGRLVDLARRLPEEEIEYNAGDLPIGLDPGLTPRNGLSAAETIRRIETCRSWMVLKRVERDPAYGALLRECLEQVRAASGPAVAGMCREEGFIFVSSPGSVTPYHLDPEVNFLLQIRGSKTCHLFPPAVVSQEDLEARFCGAHRNLVYDEAVQARARSVLLRPGDGVHIPVATPHWVATGDVPSISFSVTFRTTASERRSTLYRVNGHLRRIGLRPAPVGRSAARDDLKLKAFDGLRRLARTLRGRPREHGDAR